MSKNVAVFVDVANIFYAAKAAGVDIDYVTLLKAATAGRDFVRAYAYTGLDPENENQRQFHSFLARSGYKVVSKDIRKYGDGRIKANLDIELVVDLMRTARNLDVAVVVSGDGDFAPAIRAVQQMGVRVEVVSFRGNTSSDLIEVADVFTDITQIARVEKGTSRSGRRVAAEGDLSMTEVPDKETEGAVRRRRGGRGRGGEREDQPAAAAELDFAGAASMPGNLIVLPGEKLSRVGPAAEDGTGLDAGEGEARDAEEIAGGESGEGRRRRRRRGGRGRGRGRTEAEVAAGVDAPIDAEDEEGLEPEPVRLPQHSTFGSVWDTQLGVPSAPLVPTGHVADDDLEDEPEIPEYLLAERRQRGQRGRQGPGRPGGRDRGGRAAGYQAAIERERFGRGGGGSTASTFGQPRRQDQGRPDPGRQDRGRRQRGAGPGRPERPPRVEQPTSRSTSGDPWSEVPPDIAEMLRAELARRGGRGGDAAPDLVAVPVSAQPDPELDESIVLPTEAELAGAVPEEGAPIEERPLQPAVARATPAATGRRRTTRRDAASEGPEATPEAVADEPTLDAVAAPVDGAGEAEAAAPRRRSTARRRSSAAEPEATAAETSSASDGPEPAAPARRRATRRKTTEGAAAEGGDGTGATGDAAAPATEEATEPAKPRRRTTRRTTTAETEG